ncbi:NAD(P)-dependent oxidoreductase [Georgenia sp. SYP-B2076]|uniref:NAD(P)-dependent oxidoreductase n=1 Tax=Georgenia sp. SYP-B2076 TaxID=2495881 RepID=UPI000F8D6911|nr:NAD(P)-dependent oxidoreductase [Georgenia sp. SYP-B2076]
MTRIGFIGLGVMGRPMAGHILDGIGEGGSLVINNYDRERVTHLLERGATWAENAREVAQAADVVIVMVPDIPDVRAICEGPDGLVAGVSAPTVLVVSSTVSPEGVRELDVDLARRSDGLLRVVDAPVSGGEAGAVAGTLSIMVGGDDEPVARVLPVLAHTGTPLHLGPLGAGQVAKACNQLICAAEITAIAEASVVAERAGLDVGRLFELLQGGYAGSRVLADKGPRYATKDYSVSGAAKFWVKDLAAYLAEAERTGTPSVQGEALHRAFTELTAQGLGDQDTAVVQAYIANLPA